MHTMVKLVPGHFHWRRPAALGHEWALDELLPDYYPQDHLMVVAPDGPRTMGLIAGTVLAMTTLFYHRALRPDPDYYDYPRHFILFPEHCINPSATLAQHGDAWGQLDIWPPCQWLTNAGSPRAMLRQALDHQVNRLLWPAGWRATADDPTGQPPIPGYDRRLLATRLKSVWLYRPPTPTLVLVATPEVEAIAREAMRRLPLSEADRQAMLATREASALSCPRAWPESLAEQSPAAFLEDQAAAFVAPGT